jgi:D-tyrosyl-tRNA(Tyr) deacylase
MRAVAQRVTEAHVDVDRDEVGRIGHGLLVYLGVGRDDEEGDAAWMANKLAALRVFIDEEGKMSRAVAAASGAVLVVSQFTLFGDTRRGNRPSFDDAAPPDKAEALIESVIAHLRGRGLTVATGRFRTMMRVHASVDGPITILIDSKKTF